MIELISRVVVFGINMFVRHQAKRDALKENYYEFIKKFDHESKVSSKMHERYEKWKRSRKDKD